jgi:hypothetical protein
MKSSCFNKGLLLWEPPSAYGGFSLKKIFSNFLVAHASVQRSSMCNIEYQFWQGKSLVDPLQR